MAVRPTAIKNDKDIIGAINVYETRLLDLQTRYKEEISERVKVALLKNMLTTEYYDLIMKSGLLKDDTGEDDFTRYERQRDYVIRIVENKLDRKVPVAEANEVRGSGGGKKRR